MICGETNSGFSFEINEEALNDMEFLEALKGLDQGDMTALPDVVTTLLGKEQKQKLYDHVRSESGRVPMDKVVEEMGEIFRSSKTVKK